jgi:hypothetical protein
MSDWKDEELRAAYATRAPDAAHSPNCPSGEELLAAIRGTGPNVDRLRVLDRAMRCEACRRELALLRAVSEPAAAQRPSVKPYAWRRWAPLAAAASIVLVVGLIGIQRLFNGADNDVVRAGGSGEPVLLAPASGSAVAPGPVTFIWRPLPSALRYTLEIAAADGTVLGSTPTADTTAIALLSAAPNAEHRWWVRAHLDDGSERRSQTRLLRVR